VRGVIIGEAGQAVQAVWGGDILGDSGRVYGGGGGGGGQFQMDPEELASVIGLWEAELHKIVEDGDNIQIIMSAIKAPGEDTVSSGYASTTMDSLMALQTQNDSMRKYVQEYVKKLREAQTKTVATDQGMADPFRTV
jgi:plasmid maintenance system antidote protein VapI